MAMVKRFAIIENGIVVNVTLSESALEDNWVESDTAKINDLYDGQAFTTPEKPVTVPASVSALQGLLAIDAAGLSSAYQSWADSPERTFAEKAFINKAMTWRRDDPVLIAGATSLGLSESQIDQLFISAAGL